MAYIFPHIAIHYILKKTFELLKKKPQYIDEIFEYYDIDDFSNFFQDYKNTIKDWILNTKINIVHAYPSNFENIPIISIQTVSEIESLGKEGLGDFFEDNSRFPLEERGDFEHLLHYTFDTVVQISVFSSKNNDSVNWLSCIINWAIIQFKPYLKHLGISDPTISASDKILNRGYPNENVFSRTININCFTVNVIKSITFPKTITNINTEFYGQEADIFGENVFLIDSDIEL